MVRPIKISSTQKEYSKFGGLILACDFLHRSQAGALAGECLPLLKGGVARSQKKFEDMVLGLVGGAECLDDMAEMERDVGFREICGSVYSAKSYGDFLRSFTDLQCKQMNARLADYGYQLRQLLREQSASITFDIDSTVNQQYGKKMQGVRINHEGVLCLDSLAVFDEFGLQYANVVRAGATPTSVGAAELVHQIFSRMPKSENFADMRRFVRGDSGLCRHAFFLSCFAANAGFVVAMRSNMYGPLVHRISNWTPQSIKDESRIIFRDGRDCEIGETIYQPRDFPKMLRVVIARAPKKQAQRSLFRDEDYDYFAVVSNIGDHEMSAEKLVKFYRQRGNAENFIKEEKYGFDLHHYPCLKLTANKAYGVIAGFAYNILRFLALSKNSIKTSRAKGIRNSLIFLPIQLVHHARSVTFRFMSHHYAEVNRWQKHIRLLQFRYAKESWGPPGNWAGAL